MSTASFSKTIEAERKRLLKNAKERHKVGAGKLKAGDLKGYYEVMRWIASDINTFLTRYPSANKEP